MSDTSAEDPFMLSIMQPISRKEKQTAGRGSICGKKLNDSQKSAHSNTNGRAEDSTNVKRTGTQHQKSRLLGDLFATLRM